MQYLQDKLEGLTLSMKVLYSSTTIVQFYSFTVSLQQVARLVFLLCISAVKCCCAAVIPQMLSC